MCPSRFRVVRGGGLVGIVAWGLLGTGETVAEPATASGGRSVASKSASINPEAGGPPAGGVVRVLGPRRIGVPHSVDSPELQFGFDLDLVAPATTDGSRAPSVRSWLLSETRGANAAAAADALVGASPSAGLAELIHARPSVLSAHSGPATTPPLSGELASGVPPSMGALRTIQPRTWATPAVMGRMVR